MVSLTKAQRTTIDEEAGDATVIVKPASECGGALLDKWVVVAVMNGPIFGLRTDGSKA